MKKIEKLLHSNECCSGASPAQIIDAVNHLIDAHNASLSKEEKGWPQEYFYIDDTGMICNAIPSDTVARRDWHKDFGNWFLTMGAAKEARDQIKELLLNRKV